MVYILSHKKKTNLNQNLKVVSNFPTILMTYLAVSQSEVILPSKRYLARYGD